MSITNNNSVKPRGKSLSINELAELLDVSEQRIRQLQREGMPIFQKGGKGIAHVFSSYDAIWWYIEYEQKKKRGVAKENLDEPDEKQKINQAKLAMAQLQLQQKQGNLFAFSDWLPFIKDKMVIFRQNMSTVVTNTREKFGADVAKFVDREITRAINAYHASLNNIPNEVKE